MAEHYLHQSANDWAMCHCGKLFSDTNSSTAIDKIKKHIDKEKR